MRPPKAIVGPIPADWDQMTVDQRREVAEAMAESLAAALVALLVASRRRKQPRECARPPSAPLVVKSPGIFLPRQQHRLQKQRAHSLRHARNNHLEGGGLTGERADNLHAQKRLA